jgi:hypothetical protein
MKSASWRLTFASVGFALLIGATYIPPTIPTMTGAAKAFLDSLTPEQKAKATFQFSDDERLNWHFIPKPRKGLPLSEMAAPQRNLAHALLAAGLSQQGFIKATTVMSLDDILRIMEKDTTGRRNADGYFFSVFGEPGDNNVWGYRVEGHHLALNFTIAKGRVAGGPSFYGANPAEVREGPRKGLRALAREEDLGRELLMALDENQRKTAIVSQEAYKDILTAANRKALLEGQPSGLSASKMNAKQRELLARVVEEYATNVPGQVAQARLDQLKKAGTNLQFAWAGVAERGGPHYYRVQAQTFLIEYDNTQNNANHIHSVWRDIEGDFGLDVLAEHYKTSHR